MDKLSHHVRNCIQLKFMLEKKKIMKRASLKKFLTKIACIENFWHCAGSLFVDF